MSSLYPKEKKDYVALAVQLLALGGAIWAGAQMFFTLRADIRVMEATNASEHEKLHALIEANEKMRLEIVALKEQRMLDAIKGLVEATETNEAKIEEIMRYEVRSVVRERVRRVESPNYGPVRGVEGLPTLMRKAKRE